MTDRTSDSPLPENQPLSRRVGRWLGPLVFGFILLFVDLKPGNPEVTRMAAVAALMAIWWITEAIPLAATALLPLILYPLLGIMTGKATAPIYVNHVIFLFVGGFMIALAMEKWNLHKRVALWIIRVIGGGPSRMVLSFMIATAFLSMWISNTATSIMMLAIALAIISEQERVFGAQRTHKLSIALLLGIAYSASVGGLATLVGTPPNLSFSRIFEITFPDAPPIEFGQWMTLGLPISCVMLFVVWLLLTQVFYRSPSDLRLSSEAVEREYESLGPMKFAEWAVLAVFVMTALLWVFRKDLNVGIVTIPGWGQLLPFQGMVDDGTIAIAMAMTLFLVPSRHTGGDGPSDATVLTVDVFKKLPWHIVLLFGGGFAMAKGFQGTGLSTLIGQAFQGLEGTPHLVMIATICGSLTFLTELTSNTATTEMVLPILASIGVATNTNPLLLMVPATLSASCAFMMPVATPPNAIVFGSGKLRIVEMVKIGLVLNLIGVVVITLMFYLLGTVLFGIDPSSMPDWANHVAAPAEH